MYCIASDSPDLNFIYSVTTDHDSVLKYLLSQFVKETQKQITVSHLLIFRFRNNL